MNHRLTAIAALAVVLASLSLFSVVHGGGWLVAGIGATIAVALAGTLTRMDAVRAAVAATVLALMATFPLLSAQSWHWKLLGLLIVAVTAASVTRLKTLPVLAGAVTYLAGLLIYLNAIFASSHALARVVPTGSSLHQLWHVAGQGWALRVFAPPVPSSRGIDMLAAAGIGLMAVATDVLAVRLRSPAIAGLPLLVLFSVPITTSAKPAGFGSAVTFCLGVIGYLFLLAADGRERLRIWGRLVTVWHGLEADEQGKGPDTRALAAAGRRIGLAAISVAVIAPLLVPGLRLHGIFAKHELVGSGKQIQLPAALDLMQSQLTQPGARDRTVLTYTTTNPDPATQYLPLYVLNYFDNKSGVQDFSIVQTGLTPSSYTVVGRGKLPPAPGLSRTPVTTARTTVTISKAVTGYTSGLNFLPLPYAPSDISVPGSWQVDNATLMTYSSSAKLGGLSYTVTSKQANPSSAELSAPQIALPSSTSQYLGFSGPDQAKLLQIADKITEHAKTSIQKARALESYFTSGGFRYSLAPNFLVNTHGLMTSSHELLEFLTVDKTGFCQQFAYAMAVLARLVGIPARVAVGYTAGTEEGNGPTWKVTEADAHAWPELYFQNVGWLRFEPTPGGSGGQGTATPPSYATSGSNAGTSPVVGQQGSPPSLPGQLPGKGSQASKGLHKFVNPGAPGTATTQRQGGGGGELILLALAIVLVLAAIAPVTGRLLTRRRRWQRATGDDGLAHAAWQELRDDMDDYGLACRASESPRALARRVAVSEKLGDSARQSLDRVARAEERARYAVVPEAAGTLRADVLAVRRALSLNAGRTARWRARLLPASTLAPVRAGLQHSLDVFGWMDAAGQRVRRPRREALSRTGG